MYVWYFDIYFTYLSYKSFMIARYVVISTSYPYDPCGMTKSVGVYWGMMQSKS